LPGHLTGQVRRADDGHAAHRADLAWPRERAIATRLGRQIDNNGARPHLEHCVSGHQDGCALAGDERRRDHNVRLGHMPADERLLLHLGLGAELAGIPFHRPSNFLLHRQFHEACTEAGHLLLRHGASVERFHDGSQPACRADRL